MDPNTPLNPNQPKPIGQENLHAATPVQSQPNQVPGALDQQLDKSLEHVISETEPASKSSLLKKLIILVIALVVLGGVAFAGYKYFFAATPADETTDESENTLSGNGTTNEAEFSEDTGATEDTSTVEDTSQAEDSITIEDGATNTATGSTGEITTSVTENTQIQETETDKVTPPAKPSTTEAKDTGTGKILR